MENIRSISNQSTVASTSVTTTGQILLKHDPDIFFIFHGKYNARYFQDI